MKRSIEEMRETAAYKAGYDLFYETLGTELSDEDLKAALAKIKQDYPDDLTAVILGCHEGGLQYTMDNLFVSGNDMANLTH
jgi:hypothetical protein